MNRIISFTEWLSQKQKLEEAVKPRIRFEDMSHRDQVMGLIQVGDLIRLGEETVYQGESAQKLGIVVSVGAKIKVKPYFGNRKDIVIEPQELRLVDMMELPAQFREQLKMMGVKHFWKKMTERQLAQETRRKAREESERQANKGPETADVSHSEISRVKNWLLDDEPSEEETAPAQSGKDAFDSLFGASEEPKRTAPLSRWRRNQQSGLGRLGV